MWLVWFMLFLCFALVLLLLMRMSIMDSHVHHINTFVAKAVTFEEMEQYFAKLAKPAMGVT